MEDMITFEFSKMQEIYFLVPQEVGTGVSKIAQKVAEDVEKTVGFLPPVSPSAKQNCKKAVLVVTAGKTELAQTLKKKFPELAQTEGKRESYAFIVKEHPLESIDTGIVIYGSDKLGTIYGLFHLSELLGVPAVTDWGDCQYVEKEQIEITEKDNFFSKEPSVEYRGFFINDEWPCFGTWTTSHYDGFTAEMYDRVFEYLLRMKGNYLWPAMWSSCFFLDGPDTRAMELADEYGIYIGMSHHEPCMRSGAEYSKVRGKDSPYGDAWSYVTNREGILKFWEDGLKRSIGHHVFPTIGMRGENDSKMLGEHSSIAENVSLLKEIIVKQKEMIAQYLENGGTKVPKLFAVYKEVEDYYFGSGSETGLRGFDALEDVTLLLCEDNFGNMRALPEAFERNHKGGFGMYYHLDYHGDPISYEWVASTPLTKIWEQMSEAYEYGVRKLWIVNVGDVKFQEFPLNYFMSLAYDFEQWGTNARNSTAAYTRKWISQIFGAYTSDEEQSKIYDVLHGYLKLNSLRKPEALNDTVYHPAHELECERMLETCRILEEKNESLIKCLREREMADAYYSMIYFPAAASINLLKMHLYSGKNHLYALQGKAAANYYDRFVEDCILRDKKLAEEMGAFRDKKWYGMQLASHIGFTNWNDEDWRYPVRHIVRLPQKARLVVSKADETEHYTNQYFPKPLIISDFLDAANSQVKIQVSNGGAEPLHWEVVPGTRKVGMDGIATRADQTGECEWLSFSDTEGTTELWDEIVLTLQKDKLPPVCDMEYGFEVRTETEFVPVIVRVHREDIAQIPENTFVSQNGVFVMRAEHYAERTQGSFGEEKAVFEKIEDYGKYGSGMKVFPVTSSFKTQENAPSLLYQVWGKKPGEYILKFCTSPANPLIYGGKLHMDVQINNAGWHTVCFTGDGYKGGEPGCRDWEKAVLDQEHVGFVKVQLKEGLNKIRIFPREAGLVLENLVLYPDTAVLEESYLGPKESMLIAE